MSTQSGGFDVTQNAGSVADRETEGAWVLVEDETGEQVFFTDPNGSRRNVRILVAGTYSRQHKAIIHKQRQRLLRTRRSGVTADMVEDNQREAAVACTIKWEGFLANGASFPCEPENVSMLYRQAPWIEEQVRAAMEDHTSFFRKG